MDEKRHLWKAVSSARRSLVIEHLIKQLQKGLLFAVLSYTVIILASRLFVFPYYAKVAFIVSGIILFAYFIYSLLQMPKKKQALLTLDAHFDHNELVTSLTYKKENDYTVALLTVAKNKLPEAWHRFKSRPKHLFDFKKIGIVVATLFLATLLTMIPSKTQEEAKNIENDQELINEMKKQTKEQAKENLPEEAKDKLEQLVKALDEAKTSDEALKELVKTQKELANLEQKLKQEQPTGEGAKQLEALADASGALAQNANSTLKKLSEAGKPVDLATQKTIANMNQTSSTNATTASSQSSSNGSNTQSSGNSASSSSSNSSGASQSQSGQGSSSNQQGNQSQSGQGSGEGEGEGEGNGSGSGSGQGTGNGNGTGSGTGTGNGQSPGNGSGGLGGGQGQGSRDLVASTKRIGSNNGTSTDGGNLNEGQSIEEKGKVNTTRGEIRPYSEVVSSYKESYRQSTDRLKLPNDLQRMVQSYFSAIEQ